uniref:C2H2-type domain-containing protein n=1 Tax=Oryzias latipes TaxID=8090 RepID=A0A3B3IBF4_ORYLA
FSQSGVTCGSKEMPDSGKSVQLQDQVPKGQATSHHDHEVHSAPSSKLLSAGRQKVAAQPLGNASHRKSPEVQQQSSPLGTDSLLEATSRAEQKAQKPGKYVCDYCGRACAKPSVLKKHIRSHTGERQTRTFSHFSLLFKLKVQDYTMNRKI